MQRAQQKMETINKIVLPLTCVFLPEKQWRKLSTLNVDIFHIIDQINISL